ncbi:MAG: flagellin [Gammaproteobacteria bacterium]|nr:flagellin [Gammaproteobacteria bacterium]MDH5801323.1 flagellin [Gammaproteobacteria bacterium]
MAQVINTNVASLNTQRALNGSLGDLNRALARLSSGLRLNSAKDDAAGLAISERFTAQIRGYNQAVRNASDAISLAQTAEGALQEVTTALQRIREIAVQSINATNSAQDRVSLNQEVTQLQAEITRVAGTKFNGAAVIGSGATSYVFQVGPNAGDTVSVTTVNIMSTTTGYISVVLSGTASTVSGASALLATVDVYLDSVNAARAELGAIQNRFEAVVRNGLNVAENLSASRSRIQDADFALETARLTRAQILQQAGVAMLSQANSQPQNVLSLIQ